MPKPRAAKLETPTARRRLAVRKKPYWTTISPGIHVGFSNRPFRVKRFQTIHHYSVGSRSSDRAVQPRRG